MDRDVMVRWVARLIDYGKSGHDTELDDMSLGEVADKIISDMERVE